MNSSFVNQNRMSNFSAMGITFSHTHDNGAHVLTQSMTVASTVINNNTNITCRAIGNRVMVDSELVFVFVAGKEG